MIRLRKLGDIPAIRAAIHKAVIDGFEKSSPIDGKFIRFNINNVKIPNKRFRKADEKNAKLLDKDLSVPIKGDIELFDKKTGKLLQKRRMTIGHLPYITDKFGTFIGKGTDFSLANQMRLLPGTYTREKADGNIETQFNVQGNIGFRTSMEPKTGIFRLNVGSNKLPLYPIMKKIGITDKQLEQNWGPELLNTNRTEKTDSVDRFYKRLAGYKVDKNLTPEEQGFEIVRLLKELKINPDVTEQNLGKRYDHVTPDTILRSTSKILNVFKGKEKPDDRDSLVFKSFHGVEDFLKERIEKDSGQIGRRLAFKLDTHKDLDKVLPGYFSPYLKSIVRGDTRAFPLEEINPIQMYDNLNRNIVTGEGGIGSLDMVTAEARNVHSSQFGFVDPIRGPESERIGIDTRLTHNVWKGDDKKIYSKFINAKTGKEEYLSPDQAYKKVIAFPGEMDKSSDIKVITSGNIGTARKKTVDYYLAKPSEMFSTYSNLVPMKSAVQGHRLFMAGKILGDVLPMKDMETPIVRSKSDTDEKDFETRYGRKSLSEVTPVSGEIVKINKNEIVIKDSSGQKHLIDLFDNYPLARKTQIYNTPVVEVGQKVKKGDVVAKSNFTDKHGTLALGKHLNTAYLPLRGLTFEDGIVVSDSAAKKLTSEQVYKFEVPIDEHTIVSKKNYTGYFPTIYNRDQSQKLEELGIPKPRTKVVKGDPLIMAMKAKTLTPTDLALGKLHKTLKNKYDDMSAEWNHGVEGEVVDAIVTKKKAKVYVKAQTPAKIGDKLTGRYGNKGVISIILPDHEMPLIKRTGERLDVALNPMGIISRINPAQIWEGLLGKIGKEKGKIYRMSGFEKGRYNDIVKKELKKEGIPDQEILIDPRDGELKTMVTYPYYYKMVQMSEEKIGAREVSSYTSNMQPVKGKVHSGTSGIIYSSSLTPLKAQKAEGGAIKIGADLLTHLQSHGARHNLRDFGIKGEKNDDFWRALRLGYPLPSPDTPFVYKKFEAMLRGAGANVTKTGDMINIMPLTDKETIKMSSGEVKNSRFISARTMEPEKGGLFDFGTTGGPSGEKWSHINLAEPMPNPIMEQSVKSILGLNDKEFNKILSGEEEINGVTGGKGIRDALSEINVLDKINELKQMIPALPKSRKDKAVKELKALIGIKNSGKKLDEMMLDKFPIIPPIFRPISMLGESGTSAVSDANKLYRDLFHANDILKQLKKDGIPNSELFEEKNSLHNAIKATAGIGDPISVKNKQADVKGLLRKVVGKQPKTGFFFEKVISKTQDLSGRGIAVPDASLSIDELGVPEKIAWKINKPFIIKELVQKRGIPALTASEMVERRDPMAKSALDTVMENRPILMNRAPSLHKFAIMGFNQKLRKDNAIGTSPPITGPYNLDYDGDALQLFVPATDQAVQEIKEKMMPSKNLFSIKDYGVHYTPPHEDIHGLFIASTNKKKNKPKKFKDANEVEQALLRHEIDYDDVVEISNV